MSQWRHIYEAINYIMQMSGMRVTSQGKKPEMNVLSLLDWRVCGAPCWSHCLMHIYIYVCLTQQKTHSHMRRLGLVVMWSWGWSTRTGRHMVAVLFEMWNEVQTYCWQPAPGAPPLSWCETGSDESVLHQWAERSVRRSLSVCKNTWIWMFHCNYYDCNCLELFWQCLRWMFLCLTCPELFTCRAPPAVYKVY